MLNSSLSVGLTPLEPFGETPPRGYASRRAVSLVSPKYPGEAERFAPLRLRSVGAPPPGVDILPHRAVTRSRLQWDGAAVEFVQAATSERIEFRFRSTMHLLAAYETGVRRNGESCVDGVPRSTLRNVANKLTFVPAGCEYREWHDPQVPIAVTYFYFDPAELRIGSGEGVDDAALAPRLFFDDATIWSTIAKLRQAIDAPEPASRAYLEALGVVLIHELGRLDRATPRAGAPVRGGLAAWQQRIVSAYVEEHLAEQIPLATLARLVRLSTFHFCRAFKQSFGVPPHRYHTGRRIERAKSMLAERRHSVTEVGLSLGFSETSSFTAVFRKITGQTPSRYHRALG